MNTHVSKVDVNDYFYKCLEEFGNIEEAMVNVAKKIEGKGMICTEFACGTLSCTISLDN
ncbi:hypothetical protein H0I54_13455 [Yersinia kristensenii]|uniref:hypothetical protein n=1 Tax=Yersinia kristensenii TaxID=28152 RepID=UPI001643A46D|nr:hypothetical protein [Yersinia kristensenii]MBW5817126.1 hypothetical protein [Yersinia kristensenii]MBW5842819.1 hypothetical protein [Yersinia kristensenii]MDA5489238.1 hypothetical protein [Yersinia kristensenii]